MKVALRGWTRVTAEYKWRVESVAHTLILGEHKTNINVLVKPRFFGIGNAVENGKWPMSRFRRPPETPVVGEFIPQSSGGRDSAAEI
jgi:hypothetical protein